MHKFSIFLLAVALCCLVYSCKKDTKSNVPDSLIGEWYIKQYVITTTTNNVTASPNVIIHSDTSTNVYYQFNSNGTGFEQLNFDPNFVNIPAESFNFRISGSNIIFSHNSNLLQSTTCSFEIPTSKTLVIRSNYSSTDNFGNVINTLQELDLGK
jgi:hypothetical protein